ncbi:MAG: NAD(P)H-binding protein, partial [Chloroflexi bacterium]|nr:NAD(P)H-binding protein [Chloroflexota bacterium]
MRIAVTGATGRLGGQIASLLAADPAHHVRLLSRRELAPAGRPPRASTALADYSEPATLRAALRDIDTLVFVSSDGEATQVLIHHQNVISAAARSGVSHIVALSGLDADLASPFCYAVTNGHTERLLADSGCPFSIARALIFTEFFSGFLTQAGPPARSAYRPARVGSHSSRAPMSAGAWPRSPWQHRPAEATPSLDQTPSTWP